MYEYVALGIAAAGLLFGVKWQQAKRKYHQAVEALVAVDQALADDRVTEAEFHEIWEKFKAIFDGPKNSSDS